MDERTLKAKMTQEGMSLTDDKSDDYRADVLERAIRMCIPPRDQSDRTSYRNVCRWIREGIASGKFDREIIYRRVVDFAIEASGPGSNNPAAVFMSILKKELGYKKDENS